MTRAFVGRRYRPVGTRYFSSSNHFGQLVPYTDQLAGPFVAEVEGLGCEPVSLGLAVGIRAVDAFKEEHSLTVMENVASLVKETEPQLLVRLGARARDHERSIRRQPASRTMNRAAGWHRYEHERYSAARAHALQPRDEARGIELRCQAPEFRQESSECRSVIQTTVGPGCP